MAQKPTIPSKNKPILENPRQSHYQLTLFIRKNTKITGHEWQMT